MTESPEHGCAHRDRPPPEVVLDTNVVLDWLLFEDSNAMPLGAAIEAGAAIWIGTSSMPRPSGFCGYLLPP